LTVEEVLTAARAKLAKPGSWTQGYYALDADGEMTWPTDPSACRFCARGAVMAVAEADNPESPRVKAALGLLKKHAPKRGCITQSNDSSKMTHARVLRWFDRAIAAAKAAKGEKVRV
jgi:hypothetical protein